MSDSREVVELCIRDCPELEELPVICDANCLERVTIDGCGKFGRLQLTHCRILKEVWGTFAQLHILDCLELQELPCFAHLTCLEEFQIIRCVKVREITLPPNLKFLRLDACTELQSVSEISHLNNIVQLIISECRQLELNLTLVGMNSLQSITLEGCGKLKSFVLNKCHNLKKVLSNFDVHRLSICDCPELEELTICYCWLETVHIESCNKLQNITLPEKLTNLDLRSCRCLPRIEGMDSLTELYIVECNELDVLPIPVGLSKLIRIKIDSCRKLHNMTLPTTVSELSVHRCSWQVMEDINNLTKLTKMSISQCPELDELPNLSGMSCLEILNIDFCERLHNITLPATLRTLRVHFCGGLKRVIGTDYPTQIECIDINECPNLEELPSLARLKSISIDSCEKLENIAGIGEMKSLERMQLLFCSNAAIQGCIRKLKSLPSAFNLIGEAANGAMSNLIPSLLPEAIACADPATLFRTFNNLNGSVSAIIVCSLVNVRSSARLPTTKIIPRLPDVYMYKRPGQWMITTVVKGQHYEAVRHYLSMDQSNFSENRERWFLRFDEESISNYSCLGRGKLEWWCAWVVRTDEDWRTLPALTTILDKLHHK